MKYVYFFRNVVILSFYFTCSVDSRGGEGILVPDAGTLNGVATKAEGNIKPVNLPLKWKARRLKILERMRARKAKLDMKKKNDAILKANKQRQREKSLSQKALLTKKNSVKDNIMINDTSDKGTILQHDTSSKFDTVSKRLNTMDEKEIVPGNVDANIGIPLGTIGSGKNASFDQIIKQTKLPIEETGELLHKMHMNSKKNVIPSEKIDNSENQFGQIVKVFSNSEIDINGNGFPLRPLNIFTDIKEDTPIPNLKDIPESLRVPEGQTSTNILVNQSSDIMEENFVNGTTNPIINTRNSLPFEATDFTRISNHSESLNLENISKNNINETSTMGVTQALNSSGEQLGQVDFNQQNNDLETGFNPLFSEFGETPVFQSVDLNKFISQGNVNDLDRNSPSSSEPFDQRQENSDSISGIMTLGGEIMPIAGRPSSNSRSNPSNTASDKPKLPSTSLLGVIFEIQRALRQGKGK